MIAVGAIGAVSMQRRAMTHRIILSAALVTALAACGGNNDQAQAQSPAIESTTPAGNAGPPPGAAPAAGVGDANSEPTTAQAQPMPVDGSGVAADGTNSAGAEGASMTGGTSQDQQSSEPAQSQPPTPTQ